MGGGSAFLLYVTGCYSFIHNVVCNLMKIELTGYFEILVSYRVRIYVYLFYLGFVIP